ncbi:MAG: DUF3168 domain-containing protein [Pseudomonadota bacterium]
MSDVRVTLALLAANATLVASVPFDRIVAGSVPQGTALPAISVKHVSTKRRRPVANVASKFCTSRVQITIHAKNYPEQKAVAALVRAALPATRGVVAGVNVDSVEHELDGPDTGDDAAGIFQESVDYMIKYNE